MRRRQPVDPRPIYGPPRRPLHINDLEIAREYSRIGNFEAASANALIALVQYFKDEDTSRAEMIRVGGPW